MVRVAVQGCVHGELDKIYATIAAADEAAGRRTEVVVLCGDVQALRNAGDLASLAVPDKYKRMGDFQRYYAGASVAPYLTVLVGGNHEGSGYLDELPLGGWIAPNMYFLGHAGAVRVEGVTIAGLSGIYKDRDFDSGRWERAPYNASSVRSAYHVRRFDVDRLALLSTVGHVAPDVLVTHDWPASITRYGDKDRLFAAKPFFRPDAEKGELGNPFTDGMGEKLRPRYWFAAHLHIKFPARIAWGEEDKAVPEAEWRPTTADTRFLALGKCSRANEHLQFVDIAPTAEQEQGQEQEGGDRVDDGPLRLSYLPEWLAILALTQVQHSSGRTQAPLQPPTREEVEAKVTELRTRQVPLDVLATQQFAPTAPPLMASLSMGPGLEGVWYSNPQTAALCELLGIENNVSPGAHPASAVPAPRSAADEAAVVERIRAAAAARKAQRRDAAADGQT